MLTIIDPFQDALTDDSGTTGVQDRLVHIRIQQRNGRKTLTTVQGLSQDYDLKRIAKVCKKVKSHKFIIYVCFINIQ